MKKICAIFLSVCMLVGIIPLFSSAATVIATGNCGAEGENGENLKWTLDDTGHLEITGKGTMKDIGWDLEWKEYEYLITSVSIADGVTSIGSRAFDECYELHEIVFPKSVSYIGMCAIANGNLTVTFMNPDCTIDIDGPSGLSDTVGRDWEPNVFIGFANSTAEKYAKSHSDVNFKLYCPHKHTSVIAAAEKTCTEDGYTSGKKCDDCGEILIKPDVVPPAGHHDLNKDHICDTCKKTLMDVPIITETKNHVVKDSKTIYEADVVGNCEGFASIEYRPDSNLNSLIGRRYLSDTIFYVDTYEKLWDYLWEHEHTSGITVKHAILDSEGNTVMPYVKSTNYYYISDSVISKNNMWSLDTHERETDGFFDLTGKRIITAYMNARPFGEGIAYVVDEEYNAFFVDKQGNILYAFPEGFSAPYGYGDGCLGDFMNKKGGCAVFSEGLIGFWSDAQYNDNLELVEEYAFDPPLCGFLDQEGRVVIPQQFYDTGVFQEGLAWVREAVVNTPMDDEDEQIAEPGKVGYIDKTGKLVIPYQFEKARAFCDGYAVVSDGEKYGIIDKTGKVVVPLEYDEINTGNNGIFVYRLEKDIELRTMDGEVLWKATTDKCSDFSDFINGVLYYISDRKVHIVTVTEKKLPGEIPGDVSGDGEVTAEDARLALRAAVGLETYAAGSPEFLAADASKDGVLSAEDARLILRAAVGLETLT